MKFLTKLFFLVSTTTIFSYNVNSQIIKRNIELSINENNVSADQLCQNDLNNSAEYKECFDTTIDATNYKELCVVLTSEKCENFYQNPMSYLPNCVDDPQVNELLSTTIISSTKSSIKLICQTDEAGNLCPIAEAFILNKKVKDKTIKNSCNSKNCINSALDMYSNLKTNLNDFQNLSITEGTAGEDSQDQIVTIMNYLNSKECLAKSSANSITISYISILITISLLLLSMF